MENELENVKKTREEEQEMQIDLIELFYALKKRVVFLVAALLIGALVAGVYTKLMITPMYSTTSTLLVLSKETTLTSIADLQLGAQLTSDYKVLITSRPVLEEVIDNLGLDMSWGTLKSAVTITNPDSTRLLEITVTDSDPQRAADIANELSDVGAQYVGDKMEVIPPKVIEDAIVPSGPVSPNLMKNIMMGAAAGLVIAAGIVVLLTLLDDTIKSEEDIEKYLGVPMLASIPDRRDYISGTPGSKSKKRKKRRRKSKWQSKKSS